MPKIRYQDFNFQGKSRDLIEKCNEIIAEYIAAGYKLTLRQLYYQLVSRDYVPNTQKSYDRVGSIVNDARLGGLIDWNALEDRTRNVKSVNHWESPKEIIETMAEQYRLDKWENCHIRPEVWIEKDALAGVIERPCTELDVSYFSCRGYVSQSEMWGAAMRFLERARGGQHTLIIHLGDHDPSGIDMSRDIEDRISGFMKYHSKGDYFHLNRIALNMDQVREYDPPPNPAKSTDSRFAAYLSEYGDESWELDALEPAVLAELITTVVEGVREDGPFEETRERETVERELLGKCSNRWSEVVDLLEGE